MTATPIEQLKREALAGLSSLDASLANMPPLLPKRKIIASPTHSPLPYRSHDWCAYLDGEEEAGGYGYGATREDAIADFMAEAVCDGRVSIAESFQLIAAACAAVEGRAIGAGEVTI